MLAEADLPVGRGSDQVFTGMGACWTFNRERPGGKGIGPTNDMGPTPTTDLPEVSPDARYQGEFIIAVLGGGYHLTRDNLTLTYHRRFQACRVPEGDEGGVCIVQTGLAFCLKFLEEVEELECERGAWQFPRCREPTYAHELNATGSGGGSLATEAVGNTNGLNARDVEEREVSWFRGYVTAFANTMAELVYNAEIG